MTLDFVQPCLGEWVKARDSLKYMGASLADLSLQEAYLMYHFPLVRFTDEMLEEEMELWL